MFDVPVHADQVGLVDILTAAAQAVISAQYFRFMFQTGFQMRAAVMSTIFRKSLRLSSAARQQYSGG